MDRNDGALLDRVRDELEAAATSLETVEHRVIAPTPLDEDRPSRRCGSSAWNYETRSA